MTHNYNRIAVRGITLRHQDGGLLALIDRPLAALLAGLCALAPVGVSAASTAQASERPIQVAVARPSTQHPTSTHAAHLERELRVGRGDTLAGLFEREGLPAGELMRLLSHAGAQGRTLARLRPGDRIRIRHTRQGRLLSLELWRRDRLALRLRAPAPKEGASPKAGGETRIITHRVRRGETLSGIFRKQGLSPRALKEVLAAGRHDRALTRLRPGQTITFRIDPQRRLERLEIRRRGRSPFIVVLHRPDGTAKSKTTRTGDRQIATAPAPIGTPPSETAARSIPAEVEDRTARPDPMPAAAPSPASATDASDEEDAGGTQARPNAPASRPPASAPSGNAAPIVHRVRKGETLAAIFKRHGLSARTVHQVLNAGRAARGLSRIRPGQRLELYMDEGKLVTLRLERSPIEALVVERKDDSYAARIDARPVERRLAELSGIIQSSLFVDGQKAGLTDGQIMELAEIFGWDIDFALEIRSGDQFRVVFEEQWVDGRKYANGPILAAEFVNRGRTYRAFRFEDGGRVGYYDEEGRSKRRAFIRTPIRFARISSRFTRKRWHPVLKRWRSHKGVDYAAPTGTPIKATGDGKVVFRGWQRGYGRVVIIQHGSKYKTLYAHMSRFRRSVRAGSSVRQGQVIGYVGQSGLASGPHLHYEFRVNGRHRNPLTVKLPRSLSLPRKQLAAFRKQTAPLRQRLASLRARQMVASKQ